MQVAYILTIETGDDTDLLGISQELSDMVDSTFRVISCHPWQREGVPSTLPGLPGQTPLGAQPNQQ